MGKVHGLYIVIAVLVALIMLGIGAFLFVSSQRIDVDPLGVGPGREHDAQEKNDRLLSDDPATPEMEKKEKVPIGVCPLDSCESVASGKVLRLEGEELTILADIVDDEFIDTPTEQVFVLPPDVIARHFNLTERAYTEEKGISVDDYIQIDAESGTATHVTVMER